MSQGSYFEFYAPVRILAGREALGRLSLELERLGCRRPLLVTDQGVRKAGLLDVLLGAARASTLILGAIYDEVPPDSGTKTVRAAAALYRSRGCDSLVALGGGSVIDTAKAVNILVTKGGEDLEAFAGAGAIRGRLSPCVIVPTTAGTGSECTCVAVIRDEERNRKLLLVSQSLLPDAAILDPVTTLTLPASITAATGVDTLTHAMEAFYCIGKNPFSDLYAREAVRIVGERLITQLRKPQDLEGRLQLAIASTMAGIAFSNSMVGLVHSLGHAAGAICHLPHGVAMNIFLPHVLEYSISNPESTTRKGPGTRRLIGELLQPLAGDAAWRATPESERPEATVTAVRSLQIELNTLAGLPDRLSLTGKVAKEDLGRIARAAIDDASLAFNPIEADLGDCMRILEKAW